MSSREKSGLSRFASEMACSFSVKLSACAVPVEWPLPFLRRSSSAGSTPARQASAASAGRMCLGPAFIVNARSLWAGYPSELVERSLSVYLPAFRPSRLSLPSLPRNCQRSSWALLVRL